MEHEKGRYYNIILNAMGFNKHLEYGVNYLYRDHIKGIYDTIPLYFKENHIVDKEEFIFSMRWVLADVFGDGCEVEEPEGLFADI